MVWVVIYIVLGAGAAAFVWTDAEFRGMDRVPLALASLLIWPLALPYYFLNRAPSQIKDMTYGVSHQHYKDFVKTKSRDLGAGVDESMKHQEELKRQQEEGGTAMERLGRAAAAAAESMGWEDPEPAGGSVVIGGPGGTQLIDPKQHPADNSRNAEKPRKGAKKGQPAVPRDGYQTGTWTNVRSKIYGDEEDDKPKQVVIGGSAPPAAGGGWNLSTPDPATAPPPEEDFDLPVMVKRTVAPPPPPRPASPPPSAPATGKTGGGWNVGPAGNSGEDRPTKAMLRARLYGDDEAQSAPLSAPATPSAPAPHVPPTPDDDELVSPPFADKNVERHIEAGDLKEAYKVAKRMHEVVTKAGDAEKTGKYQAYMKVIEQKIVQKELGG